MKQDKRGPEGEIASIFSHRDDVSDDELEFIRAMDAFKAKHKKPFPSLREILGVVKALGYRKAGA